MNLYAYVGNAPTVYTDPLGLERECSGGVDVELNLIVVKFNFDVGGSCGFVHPTELGVGLGFPGVSVGYGGNDDVCMGLEGSASVNVGPLGAGGSLEAGFDSEGGRRLDR